MDTSIIGVALPAIQSDLGYTQAELQWIFNAYVIFFGGFLLLGGRLADLFGPRKIFMWGFGLLTLSSLLAGLAWSESSLNTGRAFQGLGSALIAPASMTLLMMTFTDPKELNKAFGFWGASAAAGGSAGVFLGGVITEWINWRWVFLINIPITLTVLTLARNFLLPGKTVKGKVDVIGALLATASLVLLVYTIVSADSISTTYMVVYLSVAAILFTAFLLMQRSRKEPLLPLHIFKSPNLSAGNLVIALLEGAWIPLWFFLNLYLQQILHYSALNSGLALLPMTITIMILMVGFTGKLVQKLGFKTNLVVGLIFLTVSLIAFSNAPVNGSFLLSVLPASILGAIGMSLAYIPGTMAAVSGAKTSETGLASGIVNTSYQIGSAIGLAVIVVIAGSTTRQAMSAGIKESEALNNGFNTAFVAAALVSALATLIAILFIKKRN
jgi:EmrB/QacA subfamily drug resistance transporter